MKPSGFKKVICTTFAVLLTAAFIISGAWGEQASWDCPECGRTGNTRKFCGGCGHPAPSKEQDTEVSTAEDYLPAAIQGDKEAQYKLGYCYEHGIGVEQDYIKAYRWYKTANRNGYPAEEALKAIRGLYYAEKYKNEYFANGELKKEYLFDEQTGNVARLNIYNRYGEISRFEIYDQWDQDGNILRETDYYPKNTGKYRAYIYLHTYDDVGNRIAYTETYMDGSADISWTATYDIKGNRLTSITYGPDGSTESSRVYTYDENDHTKTIVTRSPDGKVISENCDYQYDGDHVTGYTVLNENGQVDYYYQAVWENNIRVRYTCTEPGGNVTESGAYDPIYGDMLSAQYPDDDGNRYEDYYSYGSDSFEEDFRSLSYNYRYVTKYNTKEERLQEDSFTLDSATQTWVYESTAQYSIGAEGQTQVERRYSDGRKSIEILNDDGMTILSKSYKEDGSFWYGYSYEYNEKGQSIRDNSLTEDGSIENYTVYEYDEKGNTSKWLTYKADGTFWYGYTYVYNEKGQRIRENSLAADGSIEGYSVSEYDENGEKCLETSYGSDGIKNREIYYRKTDGVRQWKWIYYNSDGTVQKEEEWENY
ncbi:MAG: sel1 repeat family protein [Clostridia bacterium]|nr:sel1 repeat family protein [Clostridia bacterium]